jgi:uncharacterized membrane protein YeiB
VLFFLAMLFILLVVGVLYAYNARREVIFARWEKVGPCELTWQNLLYDVTPLGQI